MTSGVYEILNTANGKRYIGSAVNFDLRWTAHRNHLIRGTHCNRHLQSAWAKYGESAFRFLPILTCAPTKEMLYFYEQQLFEKVAPEYNIAPIAGSQLGAKRAPGFQMGRVQSAETCRKMSIARMGMKFPTVAEANRNRIITESTREKMSLARKGKPQSAEHIAKRALAMRGNTNSLGKPRSPEAVEKTAASKRGKPLSAEHRANLSIAQKARFAVAQ